MNTLSIVVLEVEMHCVCDGCITKIVNSARSLEGVENVTVDKDSKKLIVEGKVDSSQIREGLRLRIKKRVDIVSVQPKNRETLAATNDEKFGDQLSGFKKEDTVTAVKGKTYKKKVQRLDRTIVVLKLQHYCQGCSQRIQKILRDTIGVEEILSDEANETMTIKGTMSSETLIENLKVLKRSFKVSLIEKEKQRNGSGKRSEIHSIHGKKESSIKIEESTMEMELEKAPMTIAVYKVPIHGEKYSRKNLTKIIRRIKGVQQVIINKDETITVIGTTDVKILTETMKKRLRTLVGEGEIEIQKVDQMVTEATSQYFHKKVHKQETSMQPALELSEQETPIIEVIVDINEVREQCQSPITSGNALANSNSKTEDRSPASSDREIAEWFFLIVSLLLEGASAVFDQRGNSLVSMVLAFVALLISIVELFVMARTEGLQSACFYCCSIERSKPSELRVVVHTFGLTCAVWQCLYSTLQYIYAHYHLDNPIKMSLVPFIFLVCVLISKIVRKMEEVNCQEDADIEMANIPKQSDKDSQLGDESVSIESGDHRMIDQKGQVGTKSEVQPDSSEPVDNDGSPIELGSDDFGKKCTDKSMHQE